MRVRRFVANTAQEAVAKVKKELGNDALILNSRSYKEGGFLGLFGKKRFEVLAAIDENLQRKELKIREPRAGTGRPAFQREQESILPELESLRKELGELRRAVESVSKQVSRAPAEEERVVAPQTVAPQTKFFFPSFAPVKLLSRPTVVALVGPTGVGKTTTIAKLAANFALFEGKSVGLVTIDTYRIAAVEQLKTYAEILNLPLRVVFTPGEFKRALLELSDKDLILVDTAGRSQRNRRQIRELSQFFNGRRLHETHLVLSTNTKLEDMLEAAEAFREVSFNRLIFSKLDETSNIENMLTFLERVQVPLSYLTTGQNVPEDIEVASPDVIKKYLGKEYIHA
ncbi:MAG: flagellar biosynthesis protein FlhF [Firmicutes bacterium]|nr:flagellar biosynthesis protein FlhF [Bacillota bacterium]